MSIVSLKNVEKRFNPNRPNETIALRELTIDISSAQTILLAGPSGSGKTTLLSLIGLMYRPSAGRISILGKETTLLGEKFRTLFRRRHIGFCFQHFQLISDLKVKENLDLTLYPENISIKAIRDKRSQLLRRFGLFNISEAKTAGLSGGEKQRLALARALMNNPEILLIDEPTAHLDTMMSRELIALLKTLKMEGKTLVISTHDPLILESDLADGILHLRDGGIHPEAH